MMAIGYVRVSTDRQADFGVSIEAQAEKIRAMAVVQGAALVDIIVDAGESAWTNSATRLRPRERFPRDSITSLRFGC